MKHCNEWDHGMLSIQLLQDFYSIPELFHNSHTVVWFLMGIVWGYGGSMRMGIPSLGGS